MPRSCKVITTCFIGREVRENVAWVGTPIGPFEHSQNFPTPDAVLELVSLIYELELKVDPGVEMDTLVVNNDVGWEIGNSFLQSIDGAKTFAGRVRVLTRENYGRSFGGYNYAYEACRAEYDYWTFTEDDILVNGHKYMEICINALEGASNLGFAAIQGLSTDFKLHAHGGVGTTHVRVLDAVYEKLGKLPHCEKHQPQSYKDIVLNGELEFTNVIQRLGYDLSVVQSEYPLYEFAYEYMKARRERGG